MHATAAANKNVANATRKTKLNIRAPYELNRKIPAQNPAREVSG